MDWTGLPRSGLAGSNARKLRYLLLLFPGWRHPLAANFRSLGNEGVAGSSVDSVRCERDMSLKVWRSFSSPQGGVEEIDGAISDNAAVESQFGALHLCGLAFWLWWGYVDVPMNSGLSLKFSGKQLKQHERGDLLGDAIDIAGVKSTLGEVGRAN